MSVVTPIRPPSATDDGFSGLHDRLTDAVHLVTCALATLEQSDCVESAEHVLGLAHVELLEVNGALYRWHSHHQCTPTEEGDDGNRA